MYEPHPGDVIRYDFLWIEEKIRGIEQGRKDRPCAIVVATSPANDGSQRVLLAPITHSPPPESDKNSILIPSRVAVHLGLDQERSWIKTQQVNLLLWEKGRIPVGVVPTPDGKWKYGNLPDALIRKLINEIWKNSQEKEMIQINRDS